MSSVTKRSDSGEPWLALIDEELSLDPKGSLDHDLLQIFKDLLLSHGGTQVIAEAARQIDGYYTSKFLPSDPLMRFQEDKGIAGFLAVLYRIIFDLGRFLSYKDPRQGILAQLILQLRQLPPKPFKIWHDDHLVYTNEPVFAVTMEDNWNGNFVTDQHEEQQATSVDAKLRCDQWVNFSSFLARCTASGVLDRYDVRCRYPFIDIPEALEKGVPGVRRDCRVMVAAQYILLAARVIHEDLPKAKSKNSNRDRWQLWARRFKEIADEGGLDPEVESAARAARRKMISLDPSLFSVSEGGSKPGS